MTIYVVHSRQGCWEDTDWYVEGVFSTKENAEKFIANKGVKLADARVRAVKCYRCHGEYKKCARSCYVDSGEGHCGDFMDDDIIDFINRAYTISKFDLDSEEGEDYDFRRV